MKLKVPVFFLVVALMIFFLLSPVCAIGTMSQGSFLGRDIYFHNQAVFTSYDSATAIAPTNASNTFIRVSSTSSGNYSIGQWVYITPVAVASYLPSNYNFFFYFYYNMTGSNAMYSSAFYVTLGYYIASNSSETDLCTSSYSPSLSSTTTATSVSFYFRTPAQYVFPTGSYVVFKLFFHVANSGASSFFFDSTACQSYVLDPSLSLDGYNYGSLNGVSSNTVTLTTSDTNDVIIIAAYTNAASYIGISSMTDNLTTHLTYTRRSGFPFQWLNGGTYYEVDEMWTVWTSKGNIKFTVTLTGTASGGTDQAFGVNGANTASPFDSNSTCPSDGTSTTGVDISTSNANDFVYGIWSGATGTPPSVGSGYTKIQTGSGYGSEYQILSTQHKNLNVNWSKSGYIVVGDAIAAVTLVTFTVASVVTVLFQASATLVTIFTRGSMATLLFQASGVRGATFSRSSLATILLSGSGSRRATFSRSSVATLLFQCVSALSHISVSVPTTHLLSSVATLWLQASSAATAVFARTSFATLLLSASGVNIATFPRSSITTLILSVSSSRTATFSRASVATLILSGFSSSVFSHLIRTNLLGSVATILLGVSSARTALYSRSSVATIILSASSEQVATFFRSSVATVLFNVVSSITLFRPPITNILSSVVTVIVSASSSLAHIVSITAPTISYAVLFIGLAFIFLLIAALYYLLEKD